MKIPLVDLHVQHQHLAAELAAAWHQTIAQSSFIGGPDWTAFRQEFTAFCARGAARPNEPALHTALCGNCTDAIYLVLRALGIGPGDEVICPSLTFIGSSEGISDTGARPVLVEVRDDTLLLDPAAVAAAITPRTKAILAVQLYGQTCDMDALRALASQHGLKLIEDAAQSHGASWHGVRSGRLADAACFSFFPGKNLGALGDGGAVVSHDAALIERVQMLANHGRKDKYLHQFEGVNSRLDGLQAAFLRVKLRRLDEWNAARRQVAAWYAAGLADLPWLRLPVIAPGAESVFHLYVVRCARRDALAEHLHAQGVSTGVHYPVPLHQQPAYAHLGMAPAALPLTQRAATEVLSLPIYPELTKAQADHVIAALHTWKP